MPFNFAPMTSFVTIHTLTGCATPDKYCSYKHALFFTNYTIAIPPYKTGLHLTSIKTSTQEVLIFMAFSKKNYKIGKNKISGRIIILNNKIKLKHLNLAPNPFKIKIKQTFLLT